MNDQQLPEEFDMTGPTDEPLAGDALRERRRRWRLILGAGPSQQAQASQTSRQPGEDEPDEHDESAMPGAADGDGEAELAPDDQAIDDALGDLYGQGNEGGRGAPAPDVARWLDDIRRYFPESVVDVLQQDAVQDRRFRKLLIQPDFLRQVDADPALVGQLLALSHTLPEESKAAVREVVRQVVEELQEKLTYPLHQALAGSINRALRANRPRRLRDVNWLQTIRGNLKHYQPELGTIIPEKMAAYGRQRASLRDVVLCLDQSSSMSTSVVYGGIFGSIMATVPALNTRLVAFSTKVVDLTDELTDPVDLLFGIQLRGGTDINKALTYCHSRIVRPRETIVVLLTDLYEGGDKAALVDRAAAIVADGAQLIVLLALDDKGAPRFNRTIAQELAALDIPVFACTPERFPDLMGAAVNGQSIRDWAAANGIVTAPRN